MRRPSESKRHHRPDHPQELLRKALNQANICLGLKNILMTVKMAGYREIIGAKGLSNFINGTTATLTQDHFEPLAAVWLHSPLGRNLRFLDPAKRPKFDELPHALATGNLSRPPKMKVAGRYFLYYGSYVKEDCYGIRVIEIKAGDDDILTVTDSIRDILKIAGGVRVSHGALTFFKDLPQILLLPNETETKFGFTLMAGTGTGVAEDGTLDRVAGEFLTMTTTEEAAAFRHCLLLREPKGKKDDMIAQSGAFTFPQLCQPERARHRKAFDMLKKHLPKTIPDPMVNWVAAPE
jgi:hypothetical protein